MIWDHTTDYAKGLMLYPQKYTYILYNVDSDIKLDW